MNVIINHAPFDALPNPLSREMIAETTDPRLLAGWYDALTEKTAEISTFRREMTLDDAADAAAGGKAAFCKIAARWIEHRLLTLGHRVPYPPADPRSKELTKCANRIKQLRAQVIALGGDPDEDTCRAKELAA